MLQTAETMLRFGDAIDTAGRGLQAIDDGGWTGKAADAFHDAFDTEPGRWKKSGDAFLDAADALTNYAFTLVWAQGQAKEAIAVWDEAQAATKAARTEHDTKVAQAQAQAATGAPVTVPEFQDPGKEGRTRAQTMLDRARQQLHDAGNDAERIVSDARDKAPPKPKWWQKALSFIAEVGKGAWEGILGTLQFVWDNSPVRLIVDPKGYVETIQTNIQAAQYAIQHPAEFVKAVADWETWKENPGRALGALIPSLIGTKGLNRLSKLNKLKDAPGQGCFVAGTMVLTNVGYRPIELISAGDLVLATDPASPRQGLRPVRATMVHTVFCLVDLTVAGHRISCSPEHPFWTFHKGWTKAADLAEGDVVLDAERKQHPITTVASRAGTFTVYNIEVDDLHTYHVSCSSILVHNKPMRLTPDGPKKRDAKWLKKNGIDPHKEKDLLPGKISEFDIYVDRNGNVWGVRKGRDPNSGEYLGHLDDFKE